MFASRKRVKESVKDDDDDVSASSRAISSPSRASIFTIAPGSSSHTVCSFTSAALTGVRSHGFKPFLRTNHTRSGASATSDRATPGAPARPTRPTRCTYSSAVSGSVALIRKGTPRTSMPRAATSVQTRNATCPFLNAAKFARRSSLVKAPPRDRADQMRSFATPRSFATSARNATTRSQSKLVRQKMSVRRRFASTFDVSSIASIASIACTSIRSLFTLIA